MLNVYIYMYIYIYIGWWPFKTSQPGSIQDMTSVELQLCYDEYREDPEVQHWWSKAGVENSLMMHLGWEKDGKRNGKRMGKGWEKDGKRMGISDPTSWLADWCENHLGNGWLAGMKILLETSPPFPKHQQAEKDGKRWIKRWWTYIVDVDMICVNMVAMFFLGGFRGWFEVWWGVFSQVLWEFYCFLGGSHQLRTSTREFKRWCDIWKLLWMDAGCNCGKKISMMWHIWKVNMRECLKRIATKDVSRRFGVEWIEDGWRWFWMYGKHGEVLVSEALFSLGDD